MRNVGIVLLLALSACSHLENESYLRQGCLDYAAALSQLAQFRQAHRLNAASISQVNEQNALIAGDPETGQAAVCTTRTEPSNPSGANNTLKVARNVLRGVIDSVNAQMGQEGNQSASIPGQAATFVHLDIFESVYFDTWSDIRTDVIGAYNAWVHSEAAS